MKCFAIPNFLIQLTLRMVNLEYIEYNAFKNMETVSYIDFSFSLLSNFDVNTRSVKGAWRINLYHNRIEHIQDVAFRYLIHLRLLELSNNNIHTIQTNAFQSLKLTSK